ncbi:unnamed protein product [Nezara viridula]|uniref:Uncharacterized protein n=1 Tax=Nezara viridula TaxID=85310 RepID=A0A9P0HA62_NEZVI|nr:unnamed protein product [Nezara viridula]
MQLVFFRKNDKIKKGRECYNLLTFETNSGLLLKMKKICTTTTHGGFWIQYFVRKYCFKINACAVR